MWFITGLKLKIPTENHTSNNWWDIFGLFTTNYASEKSSNEEKSTFSILDPLGLFSSTSSSTSDENTVGLFTFLVSNNQNLSGVFLQRQKCIVNYYVTKFVKESQ
jgi:hypothetical protein